MSRSRSSFDLTDVLDRAAALTPKPAPVSSTKDRFADVDLVSFDQVLSIPAAGPSATAEVVPRRTQIPPGPTGAPPPANLPRPPGSPDIPAPPPARILAPAPESAPISPPPRTIAHSSDADPLESTDAHAHATTEAAPDLQAIEASAVAREPGPPPPPDVNHLPPLERIEPIVAWIEKATQGRDVFIVDADGLPVGGQRHPAPRLAAAGFVVRALARLSPTTPGNVHSTFMAHLGDGPVFQLLSFDAGSQRYVIGLLRDRALSALQAQTIRDACQRALADALMIAAREVAP